MIMKPTRQWHHTVPMVSRSNTSSSAYKLTVYAPKSSCGRPIWKCSKDHCYRSSEHPERMELAWARWHTSHSARYVAHSMAEPQA